METELLVVGGGTSGIAAGIAAARMGIQVVIVEETPWLGGMLTAAGVSAVDGNHHLPSGIWGEFRGKLVEHYGSLEELATGWVSNTQFEPHIGNLIFQQMAGNYPNLKIIYGYYPLSVDVRYNRIQSVQFAGDQQPDLTVTASITIDATEFGDILAMAGCPYSLGRESRSESGEPWAPERPDTIIQDLTWVAILKNLNPNAEYYYPQPPEYDESLYRGTCRECYPSEGEKPVDSMTMLDYGKLPNSKYMINWPCHGNDYYANLIELSRGERQKHFQKAKFVTLGWLHFIQKNLGWRHLELAGDEFPTSDKLALIPYIRESRRVHGVSRVTLMDILDPYRETASPLYPDAIAVGDYPVDHHHQRIELPEPEEYPGIPSFSAPYGAMIPKYLDGLICAEKNISVTHIVNGSSRLQPVVLQIGQAAGSAAALSIRHHCQPRQIDLRELQRHLLKSRCWLMPFIDTQPSEDEFYPIQTVGLRGALRGVGEPWKWANRTWFYPEHPVRREELAQAILTLQGKQKQAKMIEQATTPIVTRDQAFTCLRQIAVNPGMDIRQLNFEQIQHEDYQWIKTAYPLTQTLNALETTSLSAPILRGEFAVLLETIFPF